MNSVPGPELSNPDRARNDAAPFTPQAVLDTLRPILADSKLSEVLTIIARLVESESKGTLCTIWLSDADGKHLHCAAAPSLPGFAVAWGQTVIGPKGASCGTAVYRREPVYVADILKEPSWEDYRDRVATFGIRASWSLPLFSGDGKVLGAFAIFYREVRHPSGADLFLIENASHVAAIAIEPHIHEEALRREAERLRLLLEITSRIASQLDLRQLVDALSKNLFSITRCDFCAMLLPDTESGQLRLTTLYNPESRGSLFDGDLIPIHGSIPGKAYRTGETQLYNHLQEMRDDSESFGNNVGRVFYERVKAEGLVSGCHLPLIARGGVAGVLATLKRTEWAFEADDVIFLQQVARQVAIALDNALEHEKATRDRNIEIEQRRYLQQEIHSQFRVIVGDSAPLKAALELASVVAPTDSSVLIQGETGTGKELIARAIHDLSARREYAFIKLNCATIPLGPLESELFGHEKGTFTGAVTRKLERFELANNGTLFLDEVGDVPLELQAKLLTVLQEQEFERLGSNRTHKVDVRIIAATRRDLVGMVKQARFREDLYYRLRVFPISVPTLRQRTEDIPKLVHHFMEFYARRMGKRTHEIPEDTMGALVRYLWPGNVRELQNFIERAVILSPDSILCAPTSELEPLRVLAQPTLPISVLDEMERDHILRALDDTHWVVGGRNGAAARLGLKRTSLVYRMQKLRISRPSKRFV